MEAEERKEITRPTYLLACNQSKVLDVVLSSVATYIHNSRCEEYFNSNICKNFSKRNKKSDTDSIEE